MKNSCINEVKKVIADLLGKDVKKLKRETRIVEDLGADSLDIVELLMALEDNFGIVLDDEVAQNFKTIGNVVDYINNREK